MKKTIKRVLLLTIVATAVNHVRRCHMPLPASGERPKSLQNRHLLGLLSTPPNEYESRMMVKEIIYWRNSDVNWKVLEEVNP